MEPLPTPTESIVPTALETFQDAEAVIETQRVKDVRARVLKIIGGVGAILSAVLLGVATGTFPKTWVIPGVVIAGLMAITSFVLFILGNCLKMSLEYPKPGNEIADAVQYV